MIKTIVVGSGAGGATVARELSKAGVNVTLIEKGPVVTPTEGSECYEITPVGVELLRTSCLGGTTLVTAGNAVRTNLKTFEKWGLDLKDEFDEVENDLGVITLPDKHFGNGTCRIMSAAKSLGFKVSKMPKYINPKKCKPCGKCAFGCPQNAKWTSLQYLDEAKKYGAKIVANTPITDLIIEQDTVTGVKGGDKEFMADLVILSAGAIETPRILLKTGVNAGHNLFVDTFITLGGMFKGIGFNSEVQMNALLQFDDFILAPHYSSLLGVKLQKFNATEEDILGIMVKIKDESSGQVTPDSVVKYSTAHDVELLSQGSAIAGVILKQAGVNPHRLISTPARGAHPGGTAALGEVVDENLETEISGLFVADASVFPEAPGAPPVLTILALAKRLAKHIIQERV